ncbi:hypothetical protein C9374_002537 [Naegleria lovaniensis]|uniref:Myosin motor domain-containing protein n=1 Tax=Naegleria lovaniensis TaxID=51637 RepID=A0AA88GUL5_NAELO|nr:uncharacterized protein C9374_002537 [Naegleria lovaniensis]KAG2386091.1 hypothetical protein C9374_002537 [Naegleria lovaniensis]
MPPRKKNNVDLEIHEDDSNYKLKVGDDIWMPTYTASTSAEEGSQTPSTPTGEPSFHLGTVISIDESKQTCLCENSLTKQQETLKLNTVCPANPLKLDYSVDMASLSHLNEPSVLHNLKLRYQRDDIYTYSGLFLLAVNPYKNLPIYSNEVIKKHAGKRRDDVEPHIFSVADVSYRQMLLNEKNQSMLVTGESGAGKTESVKKIIQYLATVAGASHHHQGGNLEQKLLQTNPLLEAFGNAKTLRNNNSSRFGKFISIDFGLQGIIVGTKITHYLLETTRVLNQANGERNFHFFYQILSDPEARNKYKLTGGVNSFNYVNHSGCTNVAGIDDKKEFEDTLNSMRVIGISEDEIDSCCRVIAAILHLGNVAFVDEDELSTLPASNRGPLEVASELLKVNPDGLAKGFMKPDIVTPTDRIETHVTALQATYNRNALVKSTYNRLFDWLVSRINENLISKEVIKNFIGLLDIAGFEIFEHNSFEQLCINYTNEKLQQFFNHHMFKKEQEEYLKEKIEWTFIDFGLDLQPTIDLIEKPLGILSVLDQQTFMAQKNEAGLVREITKNHGNKPIFETSKFNELEFTLKHYAGKVVYDTNDWFKRNVDPLNDDCKKTMLKSQNPFVKALFDRPSDRDDASSSGGSSSSKKQGGGGTRFKTVAAQYKQQLSELMELLASTEPHFIRCIKPNNLQKPGIIEDYNVLHQLRCNGVLEGIRISRKGYPGRILYKDFVRRYELLVEDKTKLADKNASDKDKAKAILNYIEFEETTQYKLGLTKVFLKASQEAELESLREVQISKYINVAQAAALAAFERATYRKLQRRLLSIKTIQRNFRGYSKLRDWDWWRLIGLVKPLLKEFASEKQTEKLKQDLDQLKESLQKEQEEKKKLDLEKQKMVQERDVAKEALKAAHNEIEKLASQNRTLEQTILDKEQNIKNLRDDIEYKTSNLTDQDKKLNDLYEVVKTLNEKIHNLEESIRSKDIQLKQKQQDIENREADIEFLRKKQKELESELEDEKSRYNSENKNRSQKEEDLRKSEQTNKKLRQEIEQVQKEKDDLSLELNKLKLEKKNVEEESEKKQRQVEDLTRKLDSAQQNAREIQAKLENEQQTLKSSETKGKMLSSDLETANARIQALTEEIHTLEETIASQKSQIQNLTTKISNLEEVEIRNRDTRIKDLENTLQEQKARYENEVNIKIQEFMRLKKQSDQDRQDAEQLQSKLAQEKKDLSDTVKNLEKEIKKLNKTIEITNLEKNDTLQKVSKLDQSLNQAGDEKERLAKLLQDYENTQRQLSNEKKVLEFDLQTANEKFATTSAQLEKVTNELNAEKNRNSKLENDLEDLEREKKSLTDQLNKNKSELENEKALTLKLKGEQQKLSTDLENIKLERGTLSKDKDDLKNEISQLSARVEQALKEKEHESSEKTQAQKKVSSLGKELDKLEQRINELEAQLKLEQSNKEEVETTLKLKQSSLAETTEEIKSLKIKLQSVQSELEIANSKLQEEVNKNQRLRNELKNSENKTKESNAERDDLEDEISSLNSQINELSLKLQDAERKTEQEMRNCKQLEDEIENIRRDASRSREDVENDNRQLKQQMSTLTQQSEQFGRELSDQLNKLKQENLKLKKDLKNAKRDQQESNTGAVDSQIVEALRRKYEIDIANLKSQIDQLSLLKHNLENKNITIEQENLLLKSRLETEEKLKKKYQAQKQHADKEIEELRSLAEESEDLRDELVRLRSEYQLTISKLQSGLNDEKERYNSLDKTLQQTRKELDQVKLDLMSERKKLDQNNVAGKQHYEMEIANLNQLIQELRKDKVDLVKQEKKTAQKLADLKRDLQEELSHKQEYEKKASKAEREARIATLNLQETETRYRRVESEKKRLELEDSMNREQIKQLENELENVRNQLKQEKIKNATKSEQKKRKNQVRKVLADLEDDLMNEQQHRGSVMDEVATAEQDGVGGSNHTVVPAESTQE